MIEEMDFWYLSTLFVWPQFVLAKNLAKGEIVGYLKIDLIVAKTNTHVRCWICCSNILASCTMLDVMLQHLGILYDVGYDAPTSWHDSVCPVYVPSSTRALSY